MEHAIQTLLEKRTGFRITARIAVAFCLAFTVGCGSDNQTLSTPAVEPGSDEVLATVDGQPIRAGDVDAPLRLDLYDLEWAKFETRRDRLMSLINERLGSAFPSDDAEWKQRVEVFLEPPASPRIEIPDGKAFVRGMATAPISIVEFVDFESAHSRRLQPDLIRILDRFPERVRILVRDLPLPYHRHALPASLSAHCAAEQDAYWAYHDMLLLEQSKLNAENFRRYAELLELDVAAFDACVESRRHHSRIQADAALAAEIGVHRAATLFVNGLYLPGRPDQSSIESVIRDELLRLGLDPNPVIREASSEQTAMETRLLAESRKEPTLPLIPAEFLNEPEAVIQLTRDEVDLALEDRRSLDRKFEATRTEFSGHRLLKIRGVGTNDFYSRLGLQDRDVLMIVNGSFMTVEHNLIWDAFEASDTIRILIMRKGRPHTYEYRIQ